MTCECRLASPEASREKRSVSILDLALFDPYIRFSQTSLSAPKHRQSDFEFHPGNIQKVVCFLAKRYNKTTQGRLSVASNGMTFSTEPSFLSTRISPCPSFARALHNRERPVLRVAPSKTAQRPTPLKHRQPPRAIQINTWTCR